MDISYTQADILYLRANISFLLMNILFRWPERMHLLVAGTLTTGGGTSSTAGGGIAVEAALCKAVAGAYALVAEGLVPDGECVPLAGG